MMLPETERSRRVPSVDDQRGERVIDRLDLMILAQLGIDGRLSLSDLAKKLGISRAYAGRKLRRLLDRRVTRIAAFTNPLVLGYRAFVIIGIQTSLSGIDRTAEALTKIPNVTVVFITAGRYDIIVYSMFETLEDLPRFLQQELGSMPDITSIETMMVVETKKMSVSYLSPAAPQDGSQLQDFIGSSIAVRDPGGVIDQVDLAILREMETDGRQAVSDMAKKIGVSRTYARNKLQRLLRSGCTRVIAFTSPLVLGYHVFAMIGIKAAPHEINELADKLASSPNVLWVAVVAGRYDVLAWTMFRNPMQLSAYITRQLSPMSGVRSAETMVGLDLREMAFMYLASSYAAARQD